MGASSIRWSRSGRRGSLISLWLAFGSAFALTGVAAGAFGAHGLKNVLDAEALGVFETAVRYQMYHALGLVVLAALPGDYRWSGWLFVAGILIFSGSLYLLALTGTRWLGAITPIGGVCFLAGWALLLYRAITDR